MPYRSRDKPRDRSRRRDRRGDREDSRSPSSSRSRYRSRSRSHSRERERGRHSRRKKRGRSPSPTTSSTATSSSLSNPAVDSGQVNSNTETSLDNNASRKRHRKSRFDSAPTSSVNATSAASTAPKSKAALLALIQAKKNALAAGIGAPALNSSLLPVAAPRSRAGGLASAPELIIDGSSKNLTSAAEEAAQQRRENAVLDINKAAARKRVVNPYLSHREDGVTSSSSASSSISGTNPYLSSSNDDSSSFLDRRIHLSTNHRRQHKGFRFVKAGSLIAKAERQQQKEAMMARRLDKQGRVAKIHQVEDEGIVLGADGEDAATAVAARITIPPVPKRLVDDAIQAERAGCEWWDLPYLDPKKQELAKQILKQSKSVDPNVSKKSGKMALSEDVSSSLDSNEPLCEPSNFSIERSKTWKLIHKPAEMKPVGEPVDPGPQPLRLTERERKRIRRRRRAEAAAELQDKIRLGLIPAPAPKVKMGNLHRVLGNRAVVDPSKLEKEVKEAKSQRMKDHEMRNLAAKLTPAERREKKTAKLKGDREDAEASGIHVAVFRIVGELRDARKRFKLDMNARQLYLTGVCLIVRPGGSKTGNEEDEEDDYDPVLAGDPAPVNMLIVEGGKKGVKQYKKLVLRRIKWDEDHSKYLEDRQARADEVAMAQAQAQNMEANLESHDQTSHDAGVESQNNEENKEKERQPVKYSRWPMSSSLVWAGTVVKAQFEHFRLEECPSARVARAYSKKRGCEHYWDMVK